MLLVLFKPILWLLATAFGAVFNSGVVEKAFAIVIFKGLRWLSSKTSNHLDEQIVKEMEIAYYGVEKYGTTNTPSDSTGVSGSDDHQSNL